MRTTRLSNRGFTLIELMTVMAIMAVLLALTIPSMSGIMSTNGRKQAVDTVLSTIEQARIASLENGNNVYVIFAMPTDSGVTSDAMIVVGDPPLGSTSANPILFTRWIMLPRNVRFLASTSTLVTSDSGTTGAPTQVQAYLSNNQLPVVNGNPSYAAITFNYSGSLQFPANTPLTLALFEGIRAPDGTQVAQGATASATQNLSVSGTYDTVRLSKYTGRSWSEVSTLSN
jgi:prepilin-type N-terminal cleavage/methylation domain-containing protein